MKAIVTTTNVNLRSDELNTYINDIRKYKPLSREEETNLAILMQQGSKQAEQRLINANLAFVISVAKYYQGNGMDILDLISEGNIGLCKAVRAYDYTKGNKLISFAVTYIKQEIINALCEKSRLVRLPNNRIKDNYSAISFNAPIGNDEDGERTLLDTFASDTRANSYDNEQTNTNIVIRLLSHLDNREKEIVCRLFGIGCTEETSYLLAKKFNLTEERIRQIKWEAIEKMKELMQH